MATEAEHVAECAKREWARAPFTRPCTAARYPPEVIQAFVLNKLKHGRQRQIGEFQQAVITVPAYFDEVRRKATQDAGYMAGLRGDGHHQRADRRRRRLRLPARVSEPGGEQAGRGRRFWSTTWAAARSTSR